MGREVEGISFQPSDTAFFRDILEGVVKDQRAIDLKIDAALAAGWPLSASRRCCARSCAPAATS